MPSLGPDTTLGTVPLAKSLMAEASPAMTILICEGLLACRFEEQGFGRQSAVGEGLLLAGSPRLHVVMHAAEQHVDLKPSLAEMLKQALGKRAVQPIAVLPPSVLGRRRARRLQARRARDRGRSSVWSTRSPSWRRRDSRSI